MTASRSASVEDGVRTEKAGDVFVERSEDINELEDPDAGKSDEERAAIVSYKEYLLDHLPRRKSNLGHKDRKLMWKVDLWLIPWLCLLYLLSFLDRTNIGNARLAGLETDLGMFGHDYNNSLTIFFVGFDLPNFHPPFLIDGV